MLSEFTRRRRVSGINGINESMTNPKRPGMAVAWQSGLPWFHTSSHAHFNACFLFRWLRPLSGRTITLNCAFKASFCTKNILSCSHNGVNCSPATDRHTFRIRSPYPAVPPPHRRLLFSGSSSAATSNRRHSVGTRRRGGRALPASPTVSGPFPTTIHVSFRFRSLLFWLGVSVKLLCGCGTLFCGLIGYSRQGRADPRNPGTDPVLATWLDSADP